MIVLSGFGQMNLMLMDFPIEINGTMILAAVAGVIMSYSFIQVEKRMLMLRMVI
jgi:hypothetical protein